MNATTKPMTRLEYYQELKQMDDNELKKTRRLLRLMKLLSSHAFNFSIGFVFGTCAPLFVLFLLVDDITILRVSTIVCVVAYPFIYSVRTHKRVDVMREEYNNAMFAYEDVLAEKRNVS